MEKRKIDRETEEARKRKREMGYLPGYWEAYAWFLYAWFLGLINAVVMVF